MPISKSVRLTANRWTDRLPRRPITLAEAEAEPPGERLFAEAPMLVKYSGVIALLEALDRNPRQIADYFSRYVFPAVRKNIFEDGKNSVVVAGRRGDLTIEASDPALAEGIVAERAYDPEPIRIPLLLWSSVSDAFSDEADKRMWSEVAQPLEK